MINEELASIRQFAIAGVQPPDRYNILVKAYRLREFSRCPRCDNYLRLMHDITGREIHLRCDCTWEAKITELAVANASDMDDIYVQLAGTS